MLTINTYKICDLIENNGNQDNINDLVLCFTKAENLPEDELKRIEELEKLKELYINELKRLQNHIGNLMYNLKKGCLSIKDINEQIPKDQGMAFNKFKISIAELLYLATN